MTTRTVPALLAATALLLGLSACGAEDPGTSRADGSHTTHGARQSNGPESTETEQSQEPEGTEQPDQADQSDQTDQPDQAEAAKPARITISDFVFSTPESVAPGQTIVVTNEDQVLHTVTAEDGTFDVTVDGGATVRFKAPDRPGEFPFICTPHPYMKSTLAVG